MSEDTFIKNPYFLFILIIIVILGCIAGIIVPSIVIDNNSKLAPILIFSLILFVVLCYIILRNPYNLRQTLLPIIYIGALIGGIIIIAVSDIDESGKILGIIFLSLVFLISIVIGISYSGPNGEKFFSGIMYVILLITLIVSIVIIWADVVDTGSVKVLTLICLSIILFLTLILGFISYKNKTFGKFNFLGLNPKIQIDRIKSWGISKINLGMMMIVLIVTVVMLYIGGIQFIDVYKNTTSKSDVDKNFALIWAIFNFVVAVWITIQTLYFTIALGMMYYEDYKNQCLEKVKADIDKSTGLPTGTLKTILEDEYNLAYSSTDPTKSGYVDVINQPGSINENGIFIPSEFLDSEMENIEDSPAVRLALAAYLENHRKNVIDGNPVVIPSDTDVKKLIDFTIRELKSGGVPDDIISELRRKLDEIGGQSIRYQTAEAARLAAEAKVARARTAQLAAVDERERAERQEAAARRETIRALSTADRERVEKQNAITRENDAIILAENARRETTDALRTAATDRAIREETTRRALAEHLESENTRRAALATSNETIRLATEEVGIARDEARLARRRRIDAEIIAERADEAAARATELVNESTRLIAANIEENRNLLVERARLAGRITEARDEGTTEGIAIAERRIREAEAERGTAIAEARRATEIARLATEEVRRLATAEARAEAIATELLTITRATATGREEAETRAAAERERATTAETRAATERERAEAAVAAALRIETEINPLRERIDDINFNSTQYITDTVNRIYSNTRLTAEQKQNALNINLLPFINRFNPDDAVIRAGINAGTNTTVTGLTPTLKQSLVTGFLTRTGRRGAGRP